MFQRSLPLETDFQGAFDQNIQLKIFAVAALYFLHIFFWGEDGGEINIFFLYSILGVLLEVKAILTMSKSRLILPLQSEDQVKLSKFN